MCRPFRCSSKAVPENPIEKASKATFSQEVNMATFFDSLAKAADYFGGVISPQRLGQLADARLLCTQDVASGHGGPRRRGVFHEDIAVHLERGDKLYAHDCPCWRVAFAKALCNDVLPASDVAERVQELLDLERAEWAKERSMYKRRGG